MEKHRELKQRPNFNYIESLFEIEITPEELRQVANEMERQEREFHLPGQMIRYKLSSNFCVVYRPDKRMWNRIEEPIVPQTAEAMKKTGEIPAPSSLPTGVPVPAPALSL